MTSRESWLHGWSRIGDTGVLMGTSVVCVGCGALHGVTSVVLDDCSTSPGDEPDWPFEQYSCPVCKLQARVWDQAPEDKLTARLLALRARMQSGFPLDLFADPSGHFRLGDHVRKVRGSQWQGRVVGFYSTDLTTEGYAVESDAHSGSVQIYPAEALKLDPP